MIMNNIIKHVQHYDHEKYWKMRDYLTKHKKHNKLKALWFLYRINI